MTIQKNALPLVLLIITICNTILILQYINIYGEIGAYAVRFNFWFCFFIKFVPAMYFFWLHH
jgi:hypothetical protein